MTYATMKRQCRILLIGDNKLPSDPEDMLAALEMAYIEISNKATALKLLTVNKDNAIMRQGPGDLYVRMPRLPRDDTDRLDIDSELIPAVSRIIASYISKEKTKLHLAIASEIIRDYEAKVVSYIEEMERRSNEESNNA